MNIYENLAAILEMLRLLLDMLVIVGSVVAVRDVWFRSSLEPFATWKAYTELWDGYIGKLLSCAMCLTFQLTWVIMLLYFVPSTWIGYTYRWLFYWLAAVGYANRIKLCSIGEIDGRETDSTG